MPLAVERDLGAIAAGIAGWLAARHQATEVHIRSCHRPSVGLSSETVMIDAEGRRPGSSLTGDAGAVEEWHETLVVRMAPSGPGTFEHYDLAVQAATQHAAAGAGIPVASPAEVERDERWIGSPFLVMPAVAGHIPGDIPLLDPWIAGCTPAHQADLFANVLDVVATIHRLDWAAAGLDRVVPVRDVDAELDHWAHYLAWYADGQDRAPVLTAALAWCREHRPAREPDPSLLWGDVRLGNVIFDDERCPVAVLDWEMAAIGAAEHDLGWLLGLQGMQDELFGRPVPGFPDRAEAITRYESTLGREVRDLDWYETFALLRSAAIMTRIAVLHEAAGLAPSLPVAENPVLDVLRRRVEPAGEAR